MTRVTKIYDTSPEIWVFGAVDTSVDTWVGYLHSFDILRVQNKNQNSFLAQVSTFVTNEACFFAEKMSCCKNIGQ